MTTPCLLCPNLHTPESFKADYVAAEGSHERTRLRVWGEAPGLEEARGKRGFIGPSGRILRRALRTAGLKTWSAWPNDPPLPRGLDEVATSNVVCCHPDANAFPGQQTALACLAHHAVQRGPEPWLVCGANAIEAITGFKLGALPIRGSILPVAERLGGGWCVATAHPAFLLHAEKDGGKSMEWLKPYLVLDVRRALTEREPIVPTVRFYQRAEEVRALEALLPKEGGVSVDIEGHGEDIHLVGLSWASGEAHVCRWMPEVREMLIGLFRRPIMPILHNAAFDLPELAQAGVLTPKAWVDTINVAAVYSGVTQGVRTLNLGNQTLSWVPGSVVWKGLIDHNQGPEYDGGEVGVYRDLWRVVLGRLGRRAPQESYEWYALYNGFDTAHQKALAQALQKGLERQGRMLYYTQVLQPLQKPLMDMGHRGLPFDPGRAAYHRAACERLQRMASAILRRAATEMVNAAVAVSEERLPPKGDPGRAKAMTLRRYWLKVKEEGFDFDSTKQRNTLLYDWYQLPATVTEKGNETTNDKVLEALLGRMTRRDPIKEKSAATVKPKRGTLEECVSVLRAMIAGKKWATWSRSFLSMEAVPGEEGRNPRVRTEYAQHRSTSGRHTSGMDVAEPGKDRPKIQQTQNIPRKLRDAFVADPGYVMLGADFAGIEWALMIWFASRYPSRSAFHEDLLDRFFARGFDPHSYLASIAFGKPESEVGKGSKERQIAKAYTHGRSFLGSPIGLAAEVGHPQSVGKLVCAAHDRAFRLGPCHGWMLERVKKQGYVETPRGWRIYFPEWKPKPQEVVGNWIQATAADLLKDTEGRLVSSLPEWAEWLTSTHDSILEQVREEKVEEGVALLRATMEAPIPWLDGRRWRCDVKVGRNWKEVS